mmetsp:Transcript_18880/g.52489  ORF Transcript_18880/g.52489 Transcript_18880/m.52489 type:complete len:83 (+) Transcript_18880:1650-1898(+)
MEMEDSEEHSDASARQLSMLYHITRTSSEQLLLFNRFLCTEAENTSFQFNFARTKKPRPPFAQTDRFALPCSRHWPPPMQFH